MVSLAVPMVWTKMKSEPHREHEAVPDGKSGNMKLAAPCMYYDYRHECWKGLRTFLYASGPVYLTKVVSIPKVPEIK